MLAFGLIIAIAAASFFIAVMVSSYDKLDAGLWTAGLVTVLFSSWFCFAALPGIATQSSEQIGTRWSQPITGPITTGFDDDNNIILKVPAGDLGILSLSDYKLIVNPKATPTVTHKCDETPDWMVPYTIGECWNEITVPKELTVTVE